MKRIYLLITGVLATLFIITAITSKTAHVEASELDTCIMMFYTARQIEVNYQKGVPYAKTMKELTGMNLSDKQKRLFEIFAYNVYQTGKIGLSEFGFKNCVNGTKVVVS